jgi:hypothetical protein
LRSRVRWAIQARWKASFFRKTLYAVFGAGRPGFFGSLIQGRVFYNFEGTESIFETLNGLSQAAFGIGVGFVAKL